MDFSDRKKKKRVIFFKSHCFLSSSSIKFLSVRPIIICLSFLIFLLFVSSNRFSISSYLIRPVLTVSNLSTLSSLAINSVQDPVSKVFMKLRVEDIILFPDHVLLFVMWNGIKKSDGGLLFLNCVYYDKTVNATSNASGDGSVLTQPVLSVNEYDEHRTIVRCPLPPQDFSPMAGLQRVEVGGENLIRVVDELVVKSWDMVVYEAALDGDTVVVFAKGLNLRPDRESDPGQFSCHFRSRNWGRDKNLVLTTKAITAAQEVVRCSLPRSIQKHPNKALGFQVTIGMHNNHGNSRALTDHVILPSVAKMSNSNNYGMKTQNKHELCVCTMVWNQASSLREWIKYHAWLGVERWFIYDNNSDDEIKQVIEKLEQENYNVSRHTWPWIKTQEAGFSHCSLRAKDQCNWVGFFDVDEFFYFPYPTRNQLNFPVENSLRSLVSNFSSSKTVGEIRTACHSFGPSGLSSPPVHGVTVGYTCRLQSPERHKSIVRPDALDFTLLNVVHHFRLKKGFRYLNVLQSKAVINHYKYQVWEAFRAKFYRRVATYVVDWQENQNEGSKDRAPGLGTEAIEPPNWHLQFCDVWDTGLRDFVLANLADPATELLPWERSF